MASLAMTSEKLACHGVPHLCRFFESTRLSCLASATLSSLGTLLSPLVTSNCFSASLVAAPCVLLPSSQGIPLVCGFAEVPSLSSLLRSGDPDSPDLPHQLPLGGLAPDAKVLRVGWLQVNWPSSMDEEAKQHEQQHEQQHQQQQQQEQRRWSTCLAVATRDGSLLLYKSLSATREPLAVLGLADVRVEPSGGPWGIRVCLPGSGEQAPQREVAWELRAVLAGDGSSQLEGWNSLFRQFQSV